MKMPISFTKCGQHVKGILLVDAVIHSWGASQLMKHKQFKALMTPTKAH